MPNTPHPDKMPQALKSILRRSYVVFILICLLGSWIVTIDAVKYTETQKQSALKLAGAQASDLSQRLNAAISLTYTLAVILRENQYQVQPRQFEQLATQLIKAQPAVSSLQYAPSGIVTFVVPLDGNEAIIGHNLLSDPKRNKEAFDAIDKRQLTIAGPFELIQGGLALVARLPIFQIVEGEELFWGFSTALVRVPELLKASNINELTDLGYSWNLWRTHPDTGDVHIFSGRTEHLIEDAIQYDIIVPNAIWHLAIKPQDGWLSGHVGSMSLEIAILLIIAGIGAWVTFLLLRQPFLLQKQVEQRTEELRQTNAKLRESEHRYRNLVENTDDLITRVDPEGTLLYVNPASQKYWGLSPEECIGRSTFDFIHPGDREKTIKQFQDWSDSKSDFVTFVNRQVHQSGHSTDMQWLIASLRDNRGKIVEFSSTARDISKLIRGEEALRQSEERFRLLFETNPDPVILSRSVDGVIVDVNKAFETVTGITRVDARGKNSLALGLWAEPDQRTIFLDQLKQNGEINNLEAAFRVAGDQIRTGLLSARILTLNKEQCLLITIRDITTEKDAERALIEMDRMKSEFISAATHELSTPLSAMMGYTEFLLNPEEFGGFDDEQKQDFLNEIYDRGEALSRIIDDLLDISRLESGHSIALDLQVSHLGKILARSVNYFRQNNPKHQFRLRVPDDPEDAPVLIDRHRITQVLENLLSNAIKYSAQGTLITVSAQRGPDSWLVSVEDQGIGMNSDQVDKIFDKFYRVDASDTAVGGLGLGMSIVRQIVEGHGGSIHVISTLGKGTQVTFSLPHAATSA